MAQTARNRRNGNVGGYQQAGVGMPQTVEVYKRQVMRGQKAREPRCYRLGVDGCAVPFGKQQVIPRKSFQRYLQELIDAGFIQLNRSGKTTRTANDYSFCFDWYNPP